MNTLSNTSITTAKAAPDDKTIFHLYGSIQGVNEEQRFFMLDTSSFFEMYLSKDL